jgi:AP-1 complex subunit beta-1
VTCCGFTFKISKNITNINKMHLRDSFKMNEIKRLFSSHAFITQPLKGAEIARLMASNDPRKHMEAIKNAICRMQHGEDMSALCTDVIKAIDTRNVELKRLLNFYLKKYTGDSPIRQLMCVNTFLKDFGDEKEELRCAAIDDTGMLGDGAILKNYVSSIKRSANSSSGRIRFKAANAIGRYFEADEELVLGERMADVLGELALDEDMQVCVSAVSSLRFIEQRQRVLSREEIRRLFGHYTNTRNDAALGELLGLLESRPEDAVGVDLLLPLLWTRDLRIFYLASSLILLIDPSQVQRVFDHLAGFFDLESEELCAVLGYAESLMSDVLYDNTHFMVYASDSPHVRKKKIGMLFRRLDDTSIAEIGRHRHDPELLDVILQNAIEKDHVFEGLLDGAKEDEAIRIIYEAESISERWEAEIGRFLHRVKGTAETNKYLYLSGLYCMGIPSEVRRIQDLNRMEHLDELMRLYLNMCRRGVMGKEEALRALCLLQKIPTGKERVRLVLSKLKEEGIERFLPFCMLKHSCGGDRCLTTSGILKSRVIPSPSSILNTKPYSEQGHSSSGAQTEQPKECVPLRLLCSKDRRSEILHKSSGEAFEPPFGICDGTSTESMQEALAICTAAAPSNPEVRVQTEDVLPGSVEEKAWLRFAEAQVLGNQRPGQPLLKQLIDTSGLKGVLEVDGASVVLQVDILEKPVTIHYECRRQLFSRCLEREGHYPLVEIEADVLNTKFRLVIKNAVYELRLDAKDFISPLRCSVRELEEAFTGLNDYVMLGELDLGSVHVVDASSFAFSIFGSKLYGKFFNGQILLKGPRELLRLLGG